MWVGLRFISPRKCGLACQFRVSILPHSTTVHTAWCFMQSVSAVLHAACTASDGKRESRMKKLTGKYPTAPVLCCYVHVWNVQPEMCGALDVMTCLSECIHFSSDISPPWITQQISVGKCVHRGAEAPQKSHAFLGGHFKHGPKKITPTTPPKIPHAEIKFKLWEA